MARPNIVLVGFMGSGKSEVGRTLAERTGRQLVDVDAVVEADGASIAEIFAAEGEKGFRRREKRAVQRAARSRDAIIATGGGAVLDPANVDVLKRTGVVVYLRASPDELASRLEGATDRPLLRSSEGPTGRAEIRKRVRKLFAEREPIYESVADHVVASGDRPPAEIADEIAERIGQVTPQAPKHVRVGVQPPYRVTVGSGVVEHIAEHVKLPKGAEKACVISHPRLRRLWGGGVEAGLRSAGLKVSWATFPEGEDQKTQDTASRLIRKLAREGLHRGDVVVALGGGVVGDVGGYVASIYARGIAVVQVPTTLLAMVDASIGGKTGVNLPQGKNLVGTFHQPLGVVADLDVLSTLPERELRGGLAEVIKYGLIAEPPIADLVTRRRDEIFARGDVLQQLVLRCARVKARVVTADEREQGMRAILNYGHTLGHAIESLSLATRAKLHHGEAISIGMVYAAAVARELGRSDLVEQHRRAFEAVGLPTRVQHASWPDVAERMKADKKYAKGLRFVLLEAPGRPIVSHVGTKTLQRAFAEVA